MFLYLTTIFSQIVDTPGYGNDDKVEEEYLASMLYTLANFVEHANTIILVLPASTQKLSASFQEILKHMTLAFGKSWWDYAVIGVSFWHYDEDSIHYREKTCKIPNSPEYCMDETNIAKKT